MKATQKTKKTVLELLVDRINEATGQPLEPYEWNGTRNIAQIGNYHLSHNISGYALEQMSNSSGGVRTILNRDSRKNMESQLRAFLNGLDARKSA